MAEVDGSEVHLMLREIVASYNATDQRARFRLTSRSNTESLGPCLADKALIEQAVDCVLDNAQKYSVPESPIHVSLESSRSGRLRISVASEPLRYSPDEFALWTRRGWRGAEARAITGEGDGIGLWIADVVLRAHGGSVDVQETDGGVIVSLGIPGA
jgi:signal transduction histidine kinase